jgi:hypothetical protein
VLLLGSAMLAQLLVRGRWTLHREHPLVPGRLPATLNHLRLRFALAR